MGMEKISFGFVTALVVAIILFSPVKSESTRGIVSVLEPKPAATKALIAPVRKQAICRFATVETRNENGALVQQKVRVCS